MKDKVRFTPGRPLPPELRDEKDGGFPISEVIGLFILIGWVIYKVI